MIFINVYKFILRAKHTYIHRFYFFSVDYKKHSGLVRKSYSMCKKAPCSLILARGFKTLFGHFDTFYDLMLKS